MSNQNTQPSPTFKDSLFTAGRLIVQCGFCDKIHFCLDDFEAPFDSAIPDAGVIKKGEVKDAKASIAMAIRNYDGQEETSINASYDPEILINLLNSMCGESLSPRWEFKNDPDHDDLLDAIEKVFRCTQEDAEDFALNFEIKDTDFVSVPRIGFRNIPCGRVQGVIAVDGCCEEKIAHYEETVWNDRVMIANYFRGRANLSEVKAARDTATADSASEVLIEEED